MADRGSSEEETPDGLLGWCLVANVARETAHGEGGLDIQHGTKHFRTGALLWIPPVPWDPGWGRWPAVGRHRGNGRRYVNMVVRADDLENFRVKGVYSEALVRSLNGYRHDPAAPRTLQDPWTPERAQSWADGCNSNREPLFIEGHPYAHPRMSVPNPPPAELQVDGETLHLAHYGTRGARYSRTPPPVEWTPEP
ncbi:hypothetical protein OG496_03375 [Streptomyces sp. NBC_00988]|uniref:hypothetical protein n=1 Tax=Streptomyces sp. NBC_00988 TaxID=2903704 RepID=UPI00386869BE|nr:hypothetical protein OG496_03375 [Streptomyces sp. NBC_00988]